MFGLRQLTGNRKSLRKYAAPGIVVLAAVAVLIIWLVVPARSRTAPPSEIPPVNVEVLRVETLKEVVDSFELEADIEPKRVVEISAEISARVETVCEEGRRYQKGEELMRLNDELLRAERDRLAAMVALNKQEVKQAEAQTAYDKYEYGRLDAVSTRGVASETELKEAKMKLDASAAALEAAKASQKSNEAALAAAEANLARTVIKAPFSGMVNKILKKEGSYPRAGDIVLRMVDVDKFDVVAKIPERDTPYIDTNAPVKLILNEQIEESHWSGDDAVDAKVTFVDSLADDPTHTTDVKIEIPNRQYKLSDGRLLRPHDGQIVKVRFTRRRYENVIMIPLRAIIPRENDRVVYIVEDGKAKQVEGIRLGFFKGNLVKVEGNPGRNNSPLKGGELLIIEGQYFVGPGQPVAVRKVRELAEFVIKDTPRQDAGQPEQAPQAGDGQ